MSGAAPEPIVEVHDLVFEYPAGRVLHDVGFRIARASITALVGPNGAGKTTLMACVAALRTPYSGRIRVDGIDILEHPRECHRRIGYLSDFYGLYDALTAKQCLLHAAHAQGIPAPRREASVARTAERLALGPLLASPAGALSRGQRQRLAIAQALVHEPPLLLLDEPASGLDPEARAGLSRLMKTLGGEGVTLLVSSHILAELEEYSTDMLVLRDGRLIEHRPVVPLAGDAVRLRVEMAGTVAALPDALVAAFDLADLRADASGVEFLFAGDAGRRHALLRALVEAGVPVAGLAPARAGLQAAYLDTLAEGAGGRAPCAPDERPMSAQ